jgi:hypothetical protein
MSGISVCSRTILPQTQIESFLEDRERAKDFVELHDQVQVRYGWYQVDNPLICCFKDECYSVGQP